jgi:hypothetical protein
MDVLKIDKLYVARLGIGLLPPRYDEEIGFGHMWIYWKSSEKEYHPPFRGYFPIEEEIPVEYREHNKWLRFFARQCIRGQYRVDTVAMTIMEILSDRIFIKEWSITEEQLNSLRKRCFIPKDQDYKLEGFYSWDKRRPDWHNCSSWVINVVNHVMNKANFLVCSSPKRLGIVEKEIEWDFIPVRGGLLKNE